jgi:hypothetical protein
MRILKESNSNSLYTQLSMFKNGLVDKTNIEDDLISEVRPNGIIALRFDTDEDYFRLFDLTDDDIWTLNGLFSSYGGLELFDHYTAEEDWNEGYVLNHFFNEENREKIEEIKRIIAPNLNLIVDSESAEFCRKLHNLFDRKIRNIINEYGHQMNNAYVNSMKDKIREELCDVLNSDGIYNVKYCFGRYMTTVDNLIKLYDKYGNKNSDLHTLLTSLGHDKSVSNNYLEDMYNYYDSNEFDSDSFNRSVGYELDGIISDMEDSNKFINIDEYRKIITYLTKKFKFNTWYSRPKDELKTVIKITNVNPKNNKIELEYKNRYTLITKKGNYDLEQFNNFLYHPELFD